MSLLPLQGVSPAYTMPLHVVTPKSLPHLTTNAIVVAQSYIHHRFGAPELPPAHKPIKCSFQITIAAYTKLVAETELEHGLLISLVSCSHELFDRENGVLGRTAAIQMAFSEKEHSICVLLGGLGIPFDGFLRVFGAASTILEVEGEKHLRLHMI